MIMLTRLSGTPFVLNADLIERIDATPDTVVTLADGTKYVVADSMPQVVDAVRTFRSEIVALSWQLDPSSGRTPAAAPAPSHLATVAPLPGVEVEGTPEEKN